jgi:hypothetical protein
MYLLKERIMKIMHKNYLKLVNTLSLMLFQKLGKFKFHKVVLIHLLKNKNRKKFS